jgi:nucleoside-diphosphate-sugar epimerase
MKVLITGNMGYVGPVLVRYLRRSEPNIELIGYDSGFFAHLLTGSADLPEAHLGTQHFGDVRDFPRHLLDGVDAVVHLAAISNDPMGKEFEEVTDQVNRAASVDLARLAAECGVRNFVFASSCSMYGSAGEAPRKESDPTAPLTAYARSKVGTEEVLRGDNFGEMVFTSLRFATACGMSDRLRLDLVVNDFVACALANRQITVLSDGTPWRPLIDVEDMARAIHWAITRPAENGGRWLAVNAGCNENNIQVRDLAAMVAERIAGTRVSINADAPADGRSYQVDFSLYRALAPDHQPQVSLSQSIERLRDGFERMGFSDADFRSSRHMRLNMLREHLTSGRLGADLRWT